MTFPEQYQACAELDGWKLMEAPPHCWFYYPDGGKTFPKGAHASYELSNYNSRDVLVPLIEKQPEELRIKVCEWLYTAMGNTQRHTLSFRNATKVMLSTPAQLREALLRATGKWKRNPVSSNGSTLTSVMNPTTKMGG